jgi:hypothetical protein
MPRRAPAAPPLLAAMLAAWLAGLPAAAQQTPAAVDHLILMPPPAPGSTAAAPPGHEPVLGQPPTGTGVPAIDCGRDLPCRVGLRGVLGRNGGFVVEGTALTW